MKKISVQLEQLWWELQCCVQRYRFIQSHRPEVCHLSVRQGASRYRAAAIGGEVLLASTAELERRAYQAWIPLLSFWQ